MQGEPATAAQTTADDAPPETRGVRFASQYLRARRRAKQFYLIAKGALRATLGLTGWIVGFCFLVLIYQEVTTERTVIQTISVPKPLADSGLTPEAAARRLQDAMSALLFEASSSGSSGMRVAVGMDLPEIVVPTVGISLTTLASYARTFLGLPSRRLLSGELVEYDKKAHLVLRLNANEIYRSSDPVPLDRLDELWSAAAEAALRRISPYHVALSLYDTKPAQAVDIANYLIRYYPADDENVAWAHIIVGIRARDYLRYPDAKKEFNEALAIAERSRWVPFRWMPLSVSRNPSYASVAQVQLGSTLLDQGEYEAAVNALRLATRMDQTDAGARHYLGMARMRLDSTARVTPDFVEANRLLRKAIHDYDRQGGAGDRGEASLHRSLGNALMQQDCFKSKLVQHDCRHAATEFDHAMRLAPGDQRARAAYCGALHANQGRGRERGVFDKNYDLCLAWLRQDAEAYSQILLADYLVTRARKADAIEALRDALKRDNGRPQLHAKLGTLYADAKDWDAAIQELSKAIELAPTAATLHNDLGNALYKKKDFAQAERAFAAAIERSPGNALYHVNRGAALKALGSREAEPEYREAFRLAAASDTELNNVGNTLFNIDDFERSVAAYNKAIDIEPANSLFQGNLANALRKLNQLDLAARTYEKAIRLEPSNADHHNQFGNLFYSKGDFIKAADAYRAAIALEPAHATFHSNLAGALTNLKQLDLAATTYHKAIALEPTNASHHNQLGNFFFNKGEFAKAVDPYRRAIDLEPANAAFHANLAGALRKLGQLDLAATTYQKAIALEPTNASHHNQLGILLYDNGDFTKAADAYRRAIDIEPANATFHANLAGALRKLEQLDLAATTYLKATELEPTNASHSNQAGNVFYDMGDFTKAAEAYRKAIAIDGRDAAFHSNLAGALLKLQQADAAIEEYQRAIDLEPGNAEYHNNFAGAHYEKGDFARAEAALRSAVKIEPGNAHYHANLADTLREQRQFDAAIREFQQAFELDPGNAAFFNRLGHAFYEKGSFTEAADAYRKAIAIEPQNAIYRDNLAGALSELEAREREPLRETVTAPAR